MSRGASSMQARPSCPLPGVEKALVLAEHPMISAGVLDFDLGNADSTPICWRLVDRGVPFIFHTGRIYSAFRQ